MVRFQLLGPVRLVAGDRTVEVGPAKQRCVLAALLWSQGKPVPAAELIDRVWGDDDQPEQVHNALYAYIARLRDILRKATGATVHIARSPHGYLLQVPDEQLDLALYRRRVTAARAAADHATAAALFGQAIELWQGVPLAGVSGTWAARARAALEQQHLGVLADWATAQIAAGRPGEVIDPMLMARQHHPLAEPIVKQLMVALSHAGRDEEALAAFREYRTLLAEDRGLDPTAELRELEVMILRGDPVVEHAGPIPRQLPPEPSHFTGRRSELDALEAPGHTISVVAGAGGVGKTTLVLRWARSAADRFPDGQLYLNLNGYGAGEPMPPDAALDSLLRSLGVAAAAVPPGLAERTALLRSLLADRKVLLVLDNARSPEQVRPLLPGDSGCRVVVTSRDDMAGLVAREGAHRLTLGVLPHDDAHALLRALVGAARVDAEPDSADRLIRLCDGLPLALRITAERAARDPGAPLADLAAQLADHARRLDVLDASGDRETAVRAVLSWSYDALTPATARLFRLMGLHTCPAIGLQAMACMLGLAPHEAARMADELIRLHLVQRDRAGHYRMHDLTRAYAAELARLDETITPSDLDRLLLWCLHACRVASHALSPESANPEDALPAHAVLPEIGDMDAAFAWFDLELPNLVAAVRDATRHGRDRLTWQVARNFFAYCHRRRRWQEWAEAYRLGLAAALATDHVVAQAAMHNGLGVIAKQRGDFDAALVSYTASLEAGRHIEHERLVGCALVNLGGLHVVMGRYDLAEQCLKQACETPSYGENPAFACIAYYNLGCVFIEIGNYDGAKEALLQSVLFAERAGHLHHLTYAHHSLGEVALLQADPGEAEKRAELAISLAEQAGDRLRQARSLDLLGSCLLRTDRTAALTHWREARSIAIELAHPLAEEMHAWLGSIEQAGTDDIECLDADHRLRMRRIP